MSEALKLSISENVLVRLEKAAASRGMTCEALAEAAVEHFLIEQGTDADVPLQPGHEALTGRGLAAADRGDVAPIEEVERLTDGAPDPYLASLSRLFEEWNTPEDAAAFDGL